MQIKIILLVISLLSFSNGLNFLLKEGVEKCIYEEIPADTEIKIRYQLLDKIENSGDLMAILKVQTEKKDQTLLTENITTCNLESVNYKFQESDTYSFCFHTASVHWFKDNKTYEFFIKIIEGEDEIDIQEKKYKKHGQKELRARSERLNLISNNFIRLQDMNRLKEDKLFEESEKLDFKVVVTTIFQTVIILASGIIQILSLRKFFIAKNIY